MGDYNEIHPHVRIIEDGAIAGAYYNSMERITFYVGQRIEPTNNTGIEFALATGYKEFGPIAPHVRGTYDLGDHTRIFASTAFEKDNENINLGAIIGVEFSLK